MSIEAQIAELRAFAKQNNLAIVEELTEKQSAIIPGRSVFGEIIERIEKGEADGILAWHPDRLARNPVDGGAHYLSHRLRAYCGVKISAILV